MRAIVERLFRKLTSASPKIIYILASIAFVLNLTSCRKAGSDDESSTKIMIVIPATAKSSAMGKVGSLVGNMQLIHAVINISSGDMSPILYNWSSCTDCPAVDAPPASFSFDIPVGSARLIQALAVYRDDDGNMKFYYGDTSKDLAAENESVAISIAALGLSNYAVTGQISGRIIDNLSGSIESGPTGDVDIRFNPGAGKPSLLISHSSIVNGWFSFFGITGAPFDYILVDTGRNLFNGPVDLNAAIFQPSPQVSRVSIPKHQRYVNSVWMTDEPTKLIWGYFSATPSIITNKKICYDYSTPMTRMAVANDASHTVLTAAVSASPTNNQLYLGDLPSFYVEGGVAITSGTCGGTTLSPSNLYSQFYKVHTAMLDGEGKDGAIGFYNPLIKQISNNSPFVISGMPGSLTFSGTLLPDTKDVITSIKIFKSVNANFEHIHEDDLNCSDIANGWGDFSLAGSVAVSGSSAVSIPVSVSSAEYTDPFFKSVVCPVGLGGKVFRQGFPVYSNVFSCSDCQTLHFAMSGTASTTNKYLAALGECVPVNVSLSGTPATISYNIVSDVISGTANPKLVFYSDSICSTAATNPISQSSSNKILYVRAKEANSNLAAHVAIVNNGGIANLLLDDSLLLLDSEKATTYIATVNDYLKSNNNEQGCYPISISVRKSNGVDVKLPFSAATPENFVITSNSSDLTLFSTLNNCQTNTSPLSNPIVKNTAMTTLQYDFWAKALTASTNSSTTLNASSTTFVNSNVKTVNLSSRSLPYKLSLSFSGSMYVGDCIAATVNVVDPNNANAIVSAGVQNQTFNFFPAIMVGVVSNYVFYSDSTCTAQLNSALTISPGVSSSQFYFKVSSYSASDSIKISTGSELTGTAPANITMTNPAGPYANISVPYVGSSTLGSHQYFNISISKSAGATLSCFKSLNAGSTYTPCQDINFLVNDTLILRGDDLNPAVNSNIVYKITATDGSSRDYYLKPSQYFSHVQDYVSCSNFKAVSVLYLGAGAAGAQAFSNQFSIVDSGVTYDKVSAGMFHTCAITSAGALKCWGDNSYGKIGMGSTTPATFAAPNPVAPPSGTAFTNISAGGNHSCALTNSSPGNLSCWGANVIGQLGDGTTTNRTSPAIIDGTETYASVSAAYQHTCGITNANILKCWGNNGYGQLAVDPSVNSSLNTPHTIGNYIFVSSGYRHTCAINASSKLYCWGENSSGQLGDGSTTNQYTPTAIDSTADYAAVAAGKWFTCGLTTTGVVKCWGDNSSGQLGDGTVTPHFAPVIIGDAGTVYTKLYAGEKHVCGITNTDALKCWGDNLSSQLGTGDSISARYPVTVAASATSATTSFYHTCRIAVSGVLTCVGNNYDSFNNFMTPNSDFQPYVTANSAVCARGTLNFGALGGPLVFTTNKKFIGMLDPDTGSNNTPNKSTIIYGNAAHDMISVTTSGESSANTVQIANVEFTNILANRSAVAVQSPNQQVILDNIYVYLGADYSKAVSRTNTSNVVLKNSEINNNCTASTGNCYGLHTSLPSNNAEALQVLNTKFSSIPTGSGAIYMSTTGTVDTNLLVRQSSFNGSGAVITYSNTSGGGLNTSSYCDTIGNCGLIETQVTQTATGERSFNINQRGRLVISGSVFKSMSTAQMFYFANPQTDSSFLELRDSKFIMSADAPLVQLGTAVVFADPVVAVKNYRSHFIKNAGAVSPLFFLQAGSNLTFGASSDYVGYSATGDAKMCGYSSAQWAGIVNNTSPISTVSTIYAPTSFGFSTTTSPYSCD